MDGKAGEPRLIFEGGFDERDAFEAHSRGYRSAVCVELPSGDRYPIVFYDPVRLQQDLEEEVRQGTAFIAEPGLIVVSEVTMEKMQSAVTKLAKEHYFDSLQPAADAPAHS